MQNKTVDKERLEDVKRKRMLLGIGVIVVLLTNIVCIYLSQLAVNNVDTKQGVEAVKALEGTDTAPIEAQIQNLEKQEQQAEEEWKNRPLTEKFTNAVVMGDSITTGFTGYEILTSSQVVAEKGVHLNELDSMIDTVAELNPQVVFLALGLNDVSATDGDTDTFLESYRAVLAAIRERLPEAAIYVNGILPVQESALEREPAYEKIPQYNEVLIQMCGEENLTFIDNSGLIKDEYYEPDGEHPTIEFYPLWAEHMAEVAEI